MKAIAAVNRFGLGARVFKRVLASHLGVVESALETKVFPGSGKAKPTENLIARTRVTG